MNLRAVLDFWNFLDFLAFFREILFPEIARKIFCFFYALFLHIRFWGGNLLLQKINSAGNICGNLLGKMWKWKEFLGAIYIVKNLIYFCGLMIFIGIMEIFPIFCYFIEITKNRICCFLWLKS